MKKRNTCSHVSELHAWTTEEKRLNVLWIRRAKIICVEGYLCFMETTAGLTERLETAGYDWHELVQFEVGLADLAREDKLDEALFRWGLNWERLMLAYWPDCPKPAWPAFKAQLAVLRRSLPKNTEAAGLTLEAQSLSRLTSCAPPA